jgi:hypothetical protein
MAEPFTWNPTDVVVFTNVSGENLLLDLASGPQRLDTGRSLRITASALQQPKVKTLVDAGKIKVERWRK